jgi:hypothetical protein
MKRRFQLYTTLLTMMFLILTTTAGAIIVGDGEAIPERLTQTVGDEIQAAIERDQYGLYFNSHTSVYQDSNLANGLHVTFTREGVQPGQRKGEKVWRWGLHLRAYCDGSEIRALFGDQLS